MTDRISSSGDLGAEAFRAARARLGQRAGSGATGAAGSSVGDAFRERAAAMLGTAPAGQSPSAGSHATPGASSTSGLGELLEGGVRAVDAQLSVADDLSTGLVTGQVSSPAEVAATIKRADLTLRYSLEIRNRLVDAYREVMRMSV